MTLREDMKAVSAEITDALGEPAVYSGAFGPYELNILFEEAFEAVNLHTGEVECMGPKAEAKTEEVADAKHGDTLTVDGVVYKITGIRPDGLGITTLLLSKD
ncbi:MAG: hypothetical protein AABZ23_02070 [Deltaproteobacteria bacterium]